LKLSVVFRRIKRQYGKWLWLRSRTLSGFDEIRAVWENTASFRRMLKEDNRRDSLCGKRLVWKIDPKDTGIRFASMAGVRVLSPQVCPDVETVVALVRERRSQLVVKPRIGDSSQGIYFIRGPHDIFDLKRREKITDLDEFADRIAGLKQKGWIVEPFLPSLRDERCPAHDLKFYCFYGSIGLVLEVRRHPNVRYCWWNAEGERIGKGKHDQRLFAGEGFTDLEKGWALRLSSEIPAPFMRIDFLRSSKGSFFGEFTARPGGFEYFPNRLDRWLGERYIEAQDRLLDDLWNGKTFDLFRKATARDLTPETLAS
jgi:hypothetical protein